MWGSENRDEPYAAKLRRFQRQSNMPTRPFAVRAFGRWFYWPWPGKRFGLHVWKYHK